MSKKSLWSPSMLPAAFCSPDAVVCDPEVGTQLCSRGRGQAAQQQLRTFPGELSPACAVQRDNGIR